MKRKIIQVISAVLFAAGPTVFVGAQTGSIDLTGPDSENEIELEHKSDVDVDNNTNATLNNSNSQNASSGDAKAKDNTTADGVTSGGASNSSSLSVDFSVDNTGYTGFGCLCGDLFGDFDGSISNTGPDSENEIEVKVDHDVDINNNTNFTVNNSNSQSATSGDASGRHNTTVGDVESGDASNTSDVSISFSAMN